MFYPNDNYHAFVFVKIIFSFFSCGATANGLIIIVDINTENYLVYHDPNTTEFWNLPFGLKPQ